MRVVRQVVLGQKVHIDRTTYARRQWVVRLGPRSSVVTLPLTPIDLLVREPQPWRFEMTVVESLDVGRDLGEKIYPAIR